jgi:hypothetical protein
MRIIHVKTDILKTRFGFDYSYVVNDGDGRYLYPDGRIHSSCFMNNGYHGWYKTEADAQAAIETHNKKEKVMRNAVSMTTLSDLVCDALANLTSQEVFFTAYDVTLKLRAENPGCDISHTMVRDLVSDAYYNGDLRKVYERELRDLPGQNVQAFVYAPIGYDFSKYGATASPKPVTTNKVIINATFAEVFTN